MKIILTDLHNRPCLIDVAEIDNVRATADGKATRVKPKNDSAMLVMESVQSVIDRMGAK